MNIHCMHNFVCGLMYRKRQMSGQYASVEKGSIKNVSCGPTTESPIGKIPLSTLSYLSKLNHLFIGNVHILHTP